MQFFFNEVLAQLKGIWNRLDGGQRLVVIAVIAATTVGLGGIVWYAGRPSYETVFTANTNDEIAQMKAALQQASISYTVDDSGRTFMVERSKVGLANMAKSEAGLGGGGSDTKVGGGSSIIEDSETKAWRLDNASRAMAENAIRQLDGVIAVTVAANKPRRVTAFRDRDRENRPSASITLRLKPNVDFKGIARSAASLASSQLGIQMENVDVQSASGLQRWRYDPDREAGGGSSDFLAMQRMQSDERTRTAQDLLDQMWPGKTSVSVVVELDPSWEVISQKVTPEQPLVSSEKTTKDSTTNSDTKGGAGPTGSDAPTNTNSKKNETKDRTFVTEIGERRSGKMAPEIKRLTVAVLYDRSLEQTQGFLKEDLVKAVKSIVGWNPERDKDELFSTLAGDMAPVEIGAADSGGPGIAEVALRWGPTIGQILGVIVVVLFLKGLFKRSARSAPAAATSGEAEARGEVKEEDLSPEDQHKRMRREIERSIANDPAALAKLLESWLTEQKA